MNIELEEKRLKDLQKRLDESQRVVDLINKIICNEYDPCMDLRGFFEENQWLQEELEWQKQLLSKQ